MSTNFLQYDKGGMMYNYHLSNAIKRKFGTQEDFANAIGVDPTYVSLIVNGRRKLTGEKKERWAEKLGETVEELFPEEEIATVN